MRPNRPVRPDPPVQRHRASGTARGLAAIGGAVVGIGLLAAIGWAVVGRGEEAAGEATTQATTTGPPPKPVLRVVFPEGFTIAQMAERVRAVNKIAQDKRKITPKLKPREYARLAERLPSPKGFASGKQKVPHLEGFLFPATYEFTEDTTTRELLEKQLVAFERAWQPVDLEFARSKNLTPYDVLIIASMVEEEVQVPKERPLVAAVIYNRLKAGFPLGIDATIRYGLNIPPTEAIRQSQLESDSPYNTRKFAGLPPTPISNPGLASIQAAAHPANVDYLYFVRKADCKSHFFTASEQEFLDYPRAGLRC